MCIIFYLKSILNYYFGSDSQSANITTHSHVSAGTLTFLQQSDQTNDDTSGITPLKQKWSMSRVLNAQMLSDNEIYQALSILKEQFKHKKDLKGFFDPQAFNARFLKKENKILINTDQNTFIQILHDGELHWYTLTNIKAKHGHHIRIYDSYFNDKTYRDNKVFTSYLKKIISPESSNKSNTVYASSFEIKEEANVIECSIESCQVQSDLTMCGVFAIAFAYDLCIGNDPSTQIYDEENMRKHLFECLIRKNFSEFPKTNKAVLHTNPSMTIFVSI
jgi:hypothetical protein